MQHKHHRQDKAMGPAMTTDKKKAQTEGTTMIKKRQDTGRKYSQERTRSDNRGRERPRQRSYSRDNQQRTNGGNERQRSSSRYNQQDKQW